MKSRFTHPNLCEDGLGRHLGRWHNFRIEGGAVYADLHIADSAFNTPHGDLGGYVLDMAEEDPEAFGVSIAAKLSPETMKALGDRAEGDTSRVPYRMQALRAADVVGDPAATRGGLFSIETISDRRDVPHFVTQFLDTYFADADPKTVASKALRMISTYYGEPLQMTTTPPETPLAVQVQPYVEAFGEQGYIYHGKGLTLADAYKAESAKLSQRVEDLTAQLSTLKADHETAILTLKTDHESALAEMQVKLDAALAASGEGDDLGSQERTDLTDAQKARKTKAENLQSQGVAEGVANFAAALSK